MAFIPCENSDYHSLNYWNNRFAQEENYEWCGGYSSFQSLFNRYVPKTDSILIVGNGNSNLPIDLYNDSYQFITSMDFAETSIDKLSSKSPPQINYVCADMRFMKFDRFFDTIVEKSALDVLFTKDSSPWSVSEATDSDVKNTLNAVKSCLKSDGQFISITFAEPFFRKKYLINFWNNLAVEKFGTMFHYYFILCKS
ncbi:EEF1A lysine methyltransferase 4 [Pseudolycoriella hygida]|uniref:EEF1A lysine methyltransferase 4 n=1 Tax=Pseudolycoriella hygida TaxID=35572 RepID=A0A9Q0N760_9DIPT|nr:EEF1A lysine methyltransferase 4 [Pseudolycoriella hygida]